ncbi:hypothetical protein VQL36_07210 [Chengkuizengella sp. SCS-71B]|uniref:hypothetical protein n=1 Tax=Chengkuizengella sp. SCS-71B TaxID=3115290 RepID=UPI0032C23F1A
MKPFEDMREGIKEQLMISKIKPEDFVTVLKEKIDDANVKIKDDDLEDTFSDLENVFNQ